ncbi:glycosyltransferase family 2 protein [Paenibacillus sp. NPDC058071]|uniref:glycosyltransferase family 2 protein n=1 Tax=Paenibacillus sp. NPDC058071 TaxID=3346326 RepID=UPI0036DDDD64
MPIRQQDELTNPLVSVIIPSLNAGPAFTELLEKLNDQTLRPHEIIVVDSSSEDGTLELAHQAGAKTINVLRSEFDHGGTRNFAASNAIGDILVFMTQDAVPCNERMLEALVAPIVADASVSSAYARQVAYPQASLPERLAREGNYPQQSTIKSKADVERLGIKTFFCSNVCSAIRRDVFNEMGRFPAPVIFNEDLFMAAKCIMEGGYKVAYAADAAVYHSHDYTIRQQFRRYFDNGVSMRMNEWILRYSAVGRAGTGLLRKQLSGLWAGRSWYLIPKLILETAAKLVGYKLGQHYHRLPKALCRRFSMHKQIWLSLETRQERSLGQ